VSARRLNSAEAIACGGGALLLASLFMPWFTGGTGTIAGIGTAQLDDGYSAWTTFTVADLLLGAVALAAVALPALARLRTSAGGRLTRTSAAAFAGLAMAVLVMVRVLSPPEFQLVREGGSSTAVVVFRDSDPAAGLWLGLAGCAAIVAAGCLALSGPPPAPRRAPRMAAPVTQARR
jgi:hypothetical protein